MKKEQMIAISEKIKTLTDEVRAICGTNDEVCLSNDADNFHITVRGVPEKSTEYHFTPSGKYIAFAGYTQTVEEVIAKVREDRAAL